MTAPVDFVWNGEAMVPDRRFARLCDQAFVIGERYRLVEHQERSSASHAHYFASLHDAWQSLPDHLSQQFPTTEHLRRYALIKAGFCDSHTLPCSSRAEALRLAAFIKPTDEFAIVTVSENVVTRYVAKSQSHRAMPKGEFQRSKDAVLEIVAGMLDVTPAALRDQGERAAA